MKFYRNLRRPPLLFGLAIIVFLSVLFGIAGFEYWDERELAEISGQPSAAPEGKVSIVIKAPSRILEVYNDGRLYKSYRIAVGQSKTPTPIGEWNVVWKDYNWGTGFGTRWMGLNVPWGIYGIHGTNKPWSIGQFASHGCIRMRNKDVEELFEWVPVGTLVSIEGKQPKVQRILQYQISGPDVVQLQLKLKEQGYLSERADGIFGKKTEDAVRNYQQDHNMEVTGIVNREILGMLGLDKEK